MKARTQARRRWQNMRREYFNPLPEFSRQKVGSKKKPGLPALSQKQKTREFLKKAGVYRGKMQRREERKRLGTQTVFEALGGRQEGVTPKAASRYTVKARIIVRKPIIIDGVQRGYKNIGEILKLKHLKRKRGSGSTERGTGPTIKGTMKEKKSRAKRLGGTRGGMPGKEKKKKKK